MMQLNPPLWLETPKGVGLAHLVSWPSVEHSLYWTVFLENGQIWTFANEQVRAPKNITADRVSPERPDVCPGLHASSPGPKAQDSQQAAA